MRPINQRRRAWRSPPGHQPVTGPWEGLADAQQHPVTGRARPGPDRALRLGPVNGRSPAVLRARFHQEAPTGKDSRVHGRDQYRRVLAARLYDLSLDVGKTARPHKKPTAYRPCREDRSSERSEDPARLPPRADAIGRSRAGPVPVHVGTGLGRLFQPCQIRPAERFDPRPGLCPRQ